MYTNLYFIAVPTESSTTGDSSQQDGGDVGASFIQRLPEGVSQQCKSGVLRFCIT